MRDLALRLLTYEAGAGKSFEPMESPTLRVYEKLRQSLGEFVGVAGFHSLASRALTLARPEAPSLSAARVTAKRHRAKWCPMKSENAAIQLLAIGCPTCGAKPGEQCELTTGQP
jgi:hypothetical protein